MDTDNLTGNHTWNMYELCKCKKTITQDYIFKHIMELYLRFYKQIDGKKNI